MKRLKDFVERKFRYDVDIALFIACCTLVGLFIYGIITTVFPNYAIGNKANQVTDSKAMQYLLSQVRNSRDGKYWKTKICEFADKLIS